MGLGLLSSCQPLHYQQDTGLAALHSLHSLHSQPRVDSSITEELVLSSSPTKISVNPSLETLTHGPSPDEHAYFSSPLPPQDPQDPQKPYAVGPFSVSTQPASPFSNQQAVQFQLFSILPLSVYSQPHDPYARESSESDRPLSFLDESWYVQPSLTSDDPNKKNVALGKLWRPLRKLFLEKGKSDVARVYQGAMKGLASISDGPTRLLFGDRFHSSIDFKLGSQRAGIYWKIFDGERIEFMLGSEQGVFGNDDEPSALFFHVAHTIGPDKER